MVLSRFGGFWIQTIKLFKNDVFCKFNTLSKFGPLPISHESCSPWISNSRGNFIFEWTMWLNRRLPKDSYRVFIWNLGKLTVYYRGLYSVIWYMVYISGSNWLFLTSSPIEKNKQSTIFKHPILRSKFSVCST